MRVVPREGQVPRSRGVGNARVGGVRKENRKVHRARKLPLAACVVPLHAREKVRGQRDARGETQSLGESEGRRRKQAHSSEEEKRQGAKN